MYLFGDIKSFAIESLAIPKGNERQIFIQCHLLLAGEPLGIEEEPSLLGTSVLHLRHLKKLITGQLGPLTHPLFQNLSDLEILELIYKSNQLEEEFHPDFMHLPALEHEGLWARHTFMLGETLDAYLLVVIEQSEKLKFIWKNWRTEGSGIHTTMCNRKIVLGAIDNCIAYLEEAYPEEFNSFNY